MAENNMGGEVAPGAGQPLYSFSRDEMHVPVAYRNRVSGEPHIGFFVQSQLPDSVLEQYMECAYGAKAFCFTSTSGHPELGHQDGFFLTAATGGAMIDLLEREGLKIRWEGGLTRADFGTQQEPPIFTEVRAKHGDVSFASLESEAQGLAAIFNGPFAKDRNSGHDRVA